MAFLPAVLAAIVLLAGLALIGADWYTGIRYAVSILALICCVFAVQARAYWWLIALVPIAVLWNPVWPITLPDLALRLLHIAAAAALVAAGIMITAPAEQRR
jgi:hypothetical protein